MIGRRGAPARRAGVSSWTLALASATGLGLAACSGGEVPPPPRPPQATPEAPATTPAEALPTPETAPSAPDVAPAASATPLTPRVPRTLALTAAGGCAIHDGRVLCWGRSPRADEDEAPTERAEVQRSGDYVDLVANDELACALRAGGSAECWGEPMEMAADIREIEQRLAGEADDPWAEDEEEVSAIDVVSGTMIGARDLAAGYAGACLVRGAAATSVECAGAEFEPGAVEGIRGAEGVVEVCVGEAHACGRTSDGLVRCWGDNLHGQLGDGLEDEHAETATRVRGLERVVHIACGEDHSCALRDDGSVWCWGDGTLGQLAQPEGATGESRVPVRIAGIEHANAVVAGGSATCALFDAGPPRCWGENRTGVLGDGTTRRPSAPVEASAVGSVRDLALSYDHACAIRGDDASREVVCWGLGVEGALGPRARRRTFDPAQLFADVTSPGAITFPSGSICVAAPDGARCVGTEGADEALGLEGAHAARVVDASRLRGPGPTASTLRLICNVSAGQLACRPLASLDAPPTTLPDVVDVVARGQNICALHGDGSVECGIDTPTGVRFVRLTHFPPASAIAMPLGGTNSLCVVTREGGFVVCEGQGTARQAGIERWPAPSEEDAGPPSGPTPQPTMRFRDVEGVVQLGRDRPTVRLADGRVLRLSVDAAPVVLLDRVESFAQGTGYDCARRVGDAGGEVWCWGSSDVGQLARRDASPTPVRVPGLEVPMPAAPPAPPEGQPAPPLDLRAHGVVELAVGPRNACARLSDGRVLCWGDDADGQLGRLPEALRLRPVVVVD